MCLSTHLSTYYIFYVRTLLNYFQTQCCYSSVVFDAVAAAAALQT